MDSSERDLRALAYQSNRSHGVPIPREKRDQVIVKLYFKDGKTQQQIAELMGLSEQRGSDKRRELSPEDYPVIARLLLGGEKQEDAAEKFGVSQGRISQVWAEFRDEIHKLYSGEKLLSHGIAPIQQAIAS